MSSVMPYVKWHGRDWLGDPMLRMVGPEVRGVWIDLLCAMMNAEPYGHLAVNGRPMTDDEAARMTGLNKGTFKGILKEIEDANISSRTTCGMLYCRRLVRDHEAFLSASRAGKKGGGNPNLKKENIETRSQKPEAKGPLKGTFKGTFKGVDDAGRVDCADLSTIEGQVSAIQAARDEWSLRAVDVENVLASVTESKRRKMVEEFIADVANMPDPPRSPIAYLRGYARRTMDPARAVKVDPATVRGNKR